MNFSPVLIIIIIILIIIVIIFIFIAVTGQTEKTELKRYVFKCLLNMSSELGCLIKGELSSTV